MHYLGIVKKRRHEFILFVAIFVYTLIFSYFTCLKHDSFSSFAWDLGVFNQVFYSSTHGGRLFYYTADLYMNESGNYLAMHFSPIIGLLFPLYYLFPSVYLLLVAKSSLIALASYPLFKIAKELTGNSGAGLLVGLAYLLNPGVQGVNWFDFQPQVFVPLLVFATYYMLIKKNWKFYFSFLMLSLTIEEHIFSILILLLLSHFLYNNLKSLKSPEINTYEHRIIILSIILCGAFYFLASSVKGTYQIAPELSNFTGLTTCSRCSTSGETPFSYPCTS